MYYGMHILMSASPFVYYRRQQPLCRSIQAVVPRPAEERAADFVDLHRRMYKADRFNFRARLRTKFLYVAKSTIVGSAIAGDLQTDGKALGLSEWRDVIDTRNLVARYWSHFDTNMSSR